MILQYPSRTDPIIPLDLFPSPQEPLSLSDEGLTLTGRYGTGNFFSGTETGDELNTFEPSVDDNSFEDLHSKPRFSEFSIAGYDDNGYASRTNNTMDPDNAYCISYAPKPMEANVSHPPQTLLFGSNFAEPIVDDHRSNSYTSSIVGGTGLEHTSPVYPPFSPRYSTRNIAILEYNSEYEQQKHTLLPVHLEGTHSRRRHDRSLSVDGIHYEERGKPITFKPGEIPINGILPNVTPRSSPTHTRKPMRMDAGTTANGRTNRGVARGCNTRSTKSQKTPGKNRTASKEVCVCQKRGVDGKREPVKTYTGPTKSPGQGHRSDLANNSAKKCELCHREEVLLEERWRSNSTFIGE
ncbi:hypothetical protein JR316_0009300 [Psilocybe cubensis]|uniref:Uncharacterized protein n=2 Tax=Psilocybe cubensis TaxID=181762 RepID=A0A8H7XX29_PSICU|nr:hypothetical protein JR316_0009300 [Psilocybe cubensis]KAH9478838.1 hypothetical protein JR316_0009300 [Psilocybe cubensis]